MSRLGVPSLCVLSGHFLDCFQYVKHLCNFQLSTMALKRLATLWLSRLLWNRLFHGQYEYLLRNQPFSNRLLHRVPGSPDVLEIYPIYSQAVEWKNP